MSRGEDSEVGKISREKEWQSPVEGVYGVQVEECRFSIYRECMSYVLVKGFRIFREKNLKVEGYEISTGKV
jgi:hypothetical protein